MSKSILRRLSIQIPQNEQPEFLAATFTVEVLREALYIAEAAQEDFLPCGHSVDSLGGFGGTNPMGSCMECEKARN